jgi:hypothetical protein
MPVGILRYLFEISLASGVANAYTISCYAQSAALTPA